MLFSEMLNTWSSKEKAIDLLCQFGNADEIITYIDNIPYKYQEKNRTTIVDERFYVDYNNKELAIFPTDSIKCCFYHDGMIGLLLKEDIYWVPTSFKNILTKKVDIDKYEFMCKVLPCLETAPYCPCSCHLMGRYNIDFSIENGKFISYKMSGTKKTILYETDISNAVWCYISTFYNAENYEDEFHVRIFFRNGDRVSLQLLESTRPKGYIESINFLLGLKRNVKYLLYGKNKEYKKFFKKKPEMLFEIAKQKSNK